MPGGDGVQDTSGVVGGHVGGRRGRFQNLAVACIQIPDFAKFEGFLRVLGLDAVVTVAEFAPFYAFCAQQEMTMGELSIEHSWFGGSKSPARCSRLEEPVEAARAQPGLQLFVFAPQLGVLVKSEGNIRSIFRIG